MDPTGPTVAELRAYIMRRLDEQPSDTRPPLQRDMLLSTVQFLDDYTAERATQSDDVTTWTTGHNRPWTPGDIRRAIYQRKDTTGAPAHPAGQQAAVEGTAAARSIPLADPDGRWGRIADDLNARGVPVGNPTGRLMAHVLDAFAEFEEERRAEIIAAGGDPDEDDRDPLSRAALVDLARDHRSAMRPKADDQQYDDLIEEIADTLTLSDVRIMRGAWTAINEAMPRIAYVARQGGTSPDEIARATGYTSSRIAQFIRQEKERAAAAPLVRYMFRVDEVGADGEWTNREVGEEELDPNNLPNEANRLIDESGARTRARIFLWKDKGGPDGDIVHTVERDPQ
ncbi:hypothetical protein [Streptomyces sp. NPDC017520]|uniref:hypothetical protein n=1 Tax=Streptomyces sp. NPDC017520 TaxID=3364998 RepID=UPI0037B37C9E